MESWAQVLLISAVTVFAGFCGYVAGQLFSKYVLDRAAEMRRLVGEVVYALEYNANVLFSPDLDIEKSLSVSDEMRRIAGKLVAQRSVIPLHSIVA